MTLKDLRTSEPGDCTEITTGGSERVGWSVRGQKVTDVRRDEVIKNPGQNRTPVKLSENGRDVRRTLWVGEEA